MIVKFINPQNNEGLAMQAQTQTPKIYLGNAFSISMLPMTEKPVTVEFRKISLEEAKALLSNGFISAIGHPATAAALSKILGVNVPPNRVAITLEPGATLIVFQLALGRLAPGQELGEQEIIKAHNEGKAYFVLVHVE